MTQTVYVQGNGHPRRTPLPWAQPHAPAMADAGSFLHLVPFFRADAAGTEVQRLTASSIQAARALAGGTIRLAAATLRAERDAVPDGFETPRPLERTIQQLRSFAVPRPLPLLFDILDVALAPPEATYLVFTNADICLQPHFYLGVRALLRLGFDCLMINRRTVANLQDYRGHPQQAAFEIGKAHPGADCFVFPLHWLPTFVRSDACVGIGYVMRSLLYNLVARAGSLLILEDTALTYHFGEDTPWSDRRYADYLEYNRQQAITVFTALVADAHVACGLQDFCRVFGHDAELAAGGPQARRPRWRRGWRR